MKNHILTLSIAFLSVGFSNAQETIKDAAVKSAAIAERKDSVALVQNEQQEPKKSDAKTDKKESTSESQNKMAINEQGVNKVKPRSKKSSTTKTDSSKTVAPKGKK
jgi:hypothetical protein